MTKRKTLKRSRPNGWDLSLVKFTETPGHGEDYVDAEVYYVVFGPDDDDQNPDDGQEFDTLAEAEVYYEAQVLVLSKTPNWEAQARYDEANGTINGYAPGQYNLER